VTEYAAAEGKLMAACDLWMTYAVRGIIACLSNKMVAVSISDADSRVPAFLLIQETLLRAASLFIAISVT